MTKEEFIGYIEATLKKITDLVTGVPKKTVLFVSQTNTTGMQFSHGLPISWLALATTPTEITTLKAGTEQFIDVGTGELWTKTGNTWASAIYTGVELTIRKRCLVIGKNNGKTYLFTDPGVFALVDTTTPT